MEFWYYSELSCDKKNLKWIFISYDIYETRCVFYIPSPNALGYKTHNSFHKYRMKWKFISDPIFILWKKVLRHYIKLCYTVFIVIQGIKEVTLLGQNVNSYRDISETTSYGGCDFNDTQTKLSQGFKTIYKPKAGGQRFGDLLDQVSRVDGEMRIRFTSPHPKDFPDEVCLTVNCWLGWVVVSPAKHSGT